MIREASLWEKLDNQKVHCFLCAHECIISPDRVGVCGVRKNLQGTLNTMIYADIVAANIDPIEKKPLYHFVPGSRSYSVATIGCNFKCGFCQNWQISQASLKNGSASRHDALPEQIVREAKNNRCRSISYTYTEPTIFFEYALDTAKLAREEGLYNVFVTNGYMTRQALVAVKPYLDAANVDLKSFSHDYYRKNCKARLQPVLDTISNMKSMDIWVEVTTLVIPGENDSDEELKQIADFIAGVDRMIPWHISRFHPDYEFIDYKATPLESLQRARDIGRQSGLHHIYLGNVTEGSNTVCYQCGNSIVERNYMSLNKILIKNGRCPYCDSLIPGVWS